MPMPMPCKKKTVNSRGGWLAATSEAEHIFFFTLTEKASIHRQKRPPILLLTGHVLDNHSLSLALAFLHFSDSIIIIIFFFFFLYSCYQIFYYSVELLLLTASFITHKFIPNRTSIFIILSSLCYEENGHLPSMAAQFSIQLVLRHTGLLPLIVQMGSVGNPEAWPYGNVRDCSQPICTIYCPRWCSNAVLPPPPPTATTFPLQTPDPSDPNFSPLVIAIIGILAAAFLLVTYYTVASKYCANSGSSTRGRRPAASPPPDLAGDAEGGLEESLIKSMTVCRYRKGEGVMGITDCSVCLNDFQQDEPLRLLPNCCHAFHVHCIDTWLQTHSNCPLCRVHILPLYPLPPPAVATAPPALATVPPEDRRRSNGHACDVGVEDHLKQVAPASSVGGGREQSRGEGKVGLERDERGEGSSMSAPGGGGEKMSNSMAIARPVSTSSVEGLSISGPRTRTVINLS